MKTRSPIPVVLIFAGALLVLLGLAGFLYLQGRLSAATADYQRAQAKRQTTHRINANRTNPYNPYQPYTPDAPSSVTIISGPDPTPQLNEVKSEVESMLPITYASLAAGAVLLLLGIATGRMRTAFRRSSDQTEKLEPDQKESRLPSAAASPHPVRLQHAVPDVSGKSGHKPSLTGIVGWVLCTVSVGALLAGFLWRESADAEMRKQEDAYSEFQRRVPESIRAPGRGSAVSTFRLNAETRSDVFRSLVPTCIGGATIGALLIFFAYRKQQKRLRFEKVIALMEAQGRDVSSGSSDTDAKPM